MESNNYIQMIDNHHGGLFRSINEYVVCKPMIMNGLNTVQGNSVTSLMSQIENLKSIEVLFPDDSGKFQAYDKIYLRKEAYEAAFLKAIYYVNNIPFILVPKNMVVMQEKPLQSTSGTSTHNITLA